MFSSLASFLFGSNTNCETNSETTETATTAATGVEKPNNASINLVDADTLIEVTSLTPSVTGAGDRGKSAIKRGKNKHNNARQQNKRKGGAAKAASPLPSTSSLNTKQTQLLTLSDSCDEEEFDESEWCIVGNEEESDYSPICSDNDEDNFLVTQTADIPKTVTTFAVVINHQQPRNQHNSSHSLYSGPRPQKRRNLLQKTRNNTNTRPGSGLSVSTLSPSRTVNDGRPASGNKTTADVGITRSLCVSPMMSGPHSDEYAITNNVEAICKMEESWFVTPPPCFTSIGPINMETSPYENLLIEHPSMSVYRSIRTAQENAESFVKLDLGINDNDNAEKQKQKPRERAPSKNIKAVQPRPPAPAYRLDRQYVAQLKQELMARDEQKVHIKNERNDICRSAIQRANKVRDVQSRNYNKRRSDRQHIKVFSNANNNRKSNCC